jgi:hypothetical protein
MAGLTEPISLQPGVPETVVNGATGTGVGASQQFGVPGRSGGGDRVVEYQATVVPATALVADIEKSLDGGTTWSKAVTGVDLFATRYGFFQAIAGALIRFNITTFTGAGTATVRAVVS